MKTVTVSIKETYPNVWRLTYDGHILGDSRGYRKDEALAQARVQVAQTNHGDWEGAQWVPIKYVMGVVP